MEQKANRPHTVQSTAQLIVGKIREASDHFDIVSLRRHIDACQGLFVQEQLIDVAILGQFKAGKSSFINSLIGQDILPVGVIPVTTVITRLHYEEKSGAMVTRFDGGRVDVPVDEVEQFISEEKNPANEKNVEVVDIALPVLARYPGLRLVDTPGLGSVFKYNTETSQEWLPQVGAAIVAVSADRPLSDNDLNLLSELARYTPKIILLLTKVDLLSHDQQKEVIGFFKNTLQREINRDLPVYPYSTRVSTDLLKGRIEGLLLDLSRNRGAESINILRHKVGSLAQSSLAYLEIALKTSERADEDRENLKTLILTERLNYDLIRSELFVIARENMLQTRALIAARLEIRRIDFTKRLMERLTEEMPTWKGSLWRLTRKYEEWLEENLTRELGELSRKEHRHFFGTLNKTYMSVSRSLDLFRNLLDKNIETVLGVKLTPAEWDTSVPEPTHPDVAFAKVFDFHFDLLWFLIPMFIFRGVFEKQFLKKVPGIAQMHLSRLAYQWEVRINKAIEEIRDQALKYVRDELATIDALLSRTAGQSGDIRKTINEVRGGLQDLTGSTGAR
ncbi:MAG: dynamin family protein [Syntrophorhabdales bacterium]|jgi:GTP-binding protein EngB required for normal cell division